MPFQASTSRCGTSPASAAASRSMRLLGGAAPASSPAYASLLHYRDLDLVARNTAAACARRAIATSSCTSTRSTPCAPPQGGRQPDARASCSTSTAPGACRWRCEMARRSPATVCLARGAGVAARGCRAALRQRAPRRHPASPPARTPPALFDFGADRGRRDRHRPAERHQDRRHRRDAARHRALPRERRRGVPAQPLLRAGLPRERAHLVPR